MLTATTIDPVVPFHRSRFKGRHASECPVTYLLWLLDELADEQPAFVEELKQHLQDRSDDVERAIEAMHKTLN